MAKYIVELALGIASLFIFSFIGIFIQQYIYLFIKNLPINRQKTPMIISKILNIFILTFGIISFFSGIGLDLKNFISFIGMIIFVIIIIFKEILSSVISGLFIILDNNISIGDIISYKDVHGIVLDINLRYLVLEDYIESRKHYVSNNKLIIEHFTIQKSHFKF